MFWQLCLRRFFLLTSYTELSAVLHMYALEQLTAMAASFYVATQESSCLAVGCSVCVKCRRVQGQAFLRLRKLG